MKRNFFLLISACFLTLAGFSSQALACSCIRQGSVCESYGNSNAVFIGEVLEMKDATKDSPSEEIQWTPLKFTFKVTEAFTGVESGKTVEVSTGRGGGDCGYRFEVGETYVVYAYDNKGSFGTGICSRTRRLADTDKADLEFLRDLPNKTGATISGEIAYPGGFSALGAQTTLKITLELEQLDGEKKKHNVSIDAEGKFSVKGLSGGNYKLAFTGPDHIDISEYSLEPFRVSDKSCINRHVSIQNTNVVSGRLVDRAGKPISQTWVELVPIANTGRNESDNATITAEDGSFSFENIAGGEYLIAINYSFRPTTESPYETFYYGGGKDRAAATPFVIGATTEMEDMVITLSAPIKTRDVRGRVTWENGKPAADVTVNLREVETDRDIDHVTTDKNGAFTLKGFVGKKYLIAADEATFSGDNRTDYEGESARFTLAEKHSTFKLVLKKITASK